MILPVLGKGLGVKPPVVPEPTEMYPLLYTCIRRISTTFEVRLLYSGEDGEDSLNSSPPPTKENLQTFSV